ncbi:phosphoglycerate mutase-like protein [Russula dissimulans]|nr:phosphoglycerate mutase-like protein [Russula dissimulans]
MGQFHGDVEAADDSYKPEPESEEQQFLLPSSNSDSPARPPSSRLCGVSACCPSKGITFSTLYLILAFIAGSLACFLPTHVLAPPYVGSTEVHNWPPPTPTNDFPTLFPTDVGHAGATPTGAEPALILTAPSYPVHTGAAQLVLPSTLHEGSKKKDFDLFKKWGNLSPWYSVKRGAFGIDSDPGAPEGCKVTGLHLLHRHGARYPTSYAAYGGPTNFAHRLNEAAADWTAHGDLDFLNGWTYKLGEEVDLGISTRLKYGFLLENFTDSLPVFRTESQNRMLASALNFAAGFWGIPYHHKYLQSITIEADGFNNTLAPYMTCPNAGVHSKGRRGTQFLKEWANVYLKSAQDRLQKQIDGYTLTIEDVYTMQQMCAYETVAIGFSRFCGLFTEEEWEGFSYSMDIIFWYESAFGSPLSRALGIGYVQELVARLTKTRIEKHNSSTNSTLDDNPVTFPLDHNLYVDATHEVVVLYVITALNLTSFAANGPLPTDHIPKHRSFRVSELAPFSTNVQFQLLSCPSRENEQIRIIINDAVAPLTGIEGCPEDVDGLCPIPAFVAAQKNIIANTDWDWVCHGDWEVPAGNEWNTTTGDAPSKLP